MKKIIDKSQLEKINPKYFSQELVDSAYAFYLSNDNKTKEARKEFAKRIKEEYLLKDAELKKSISDNILEINSSTAKDIEEIAINREKGLAAAQINYSNISNPTKDDKKEYSNVVKGVEIVAKRAKIKANNANYEARKAQKIKRYDLHVEYVNLMFYINEKISPVDNLKSKVIEENAQFDLKRTLTNRKFWTNLIPLFMLIVMILAYAVAKNLCNYNGDLTAIINSGIFVAVVATGAVFIYSQGGFDMSLGNAALMCALIAGLVYKGTQNLFLSLLIAVLVGALLGVINAVFATMLNLPVMVMTLTMMNIIAAINDAIIDGKMFDLSGSYGAGMITNAWIYAAFLLVFFLLCWFIFNYTKVGRRNKFIGSNKVAAKFNGINLMKAGIVSFAISGVGLGICGFVYINSMSGQIFNPSGSVLGQVGLNVIIAIVFGGMTTSGGPKSKVSCAVIGAFFVVFLEEFFNALNMVAPIGDYKYIVKGMVFIIVSLANMWDTRTSRLASGGSIQ